MAQVVSLTEMILGRDDPKFGECFVFPMGDIIFVDGNYYTFCDITNSNL